jgi:UDP:flavonoid glycosyltransferase YjiC (YdhE family)
VQPLQNGYTLEVSGETIKMITTPEYEEAFEEAGIAVQKEIHP